MRLAINLNLQNVYEITVRGLLAEGTHGVEAFVVPILVALTVGRFTIWLACRDKKFVSM